MIRKLDELIDEYCEETQLDKVSFRAYHEDLLRILDEYDRNLRDILWELDDRIATLRDQIND